MQLHIHINIEKSIELPINYQHMLQSAIYKALSEDSGYLGKLHDEGYEYGKRDYRLFTIGLLVGKHSVKDKRITFKGKISLEIRSIDARLITFLGRYYKEHKLILWDNILSVEKCIVTDKVIEQHDITVKMLTPISIHTTDPVTKKTTYYSPDDKGFNRLVNENFQRKYTAYTGVACKESINIIPVSYNKKDLFVTKYKDFYISGWYGIYRLCGERKHLDFLYQVGIGDRNAYCFGMFETLNKEGEGDGSKI